MVKFKAIEKKERALGAKLFLKAERCNSPKCVMVRRAYKPGMHGQKRHSSLSDYGRQLQEKQKLQIIYGLNNRQMNNLFKKESHDKIRVILEQRLDRVISLLGLAASTRIARQLVSHGHILVDGHKVTIPSYQVKKGGIIMVRPQSRALKIFEDVPLRLKNYSPPPWLKLEVEELKGECLRESTAKEIKMPIDINLVAEFYSR